MTASGEAQPPSVLGRRQRDTVAGGPRHLLSVSALATVLVIVAAVYPTWLTPYRDKQPVAYSLVIAAVGAVYLGVGIAAWRQRPDSRIGPLMIAAGAGWLAYQLSWFPGSIAYTWGVFTASLELPLIVWLALAYPSGTLRHRWERIVVGATGAVWLWARLVTALLEDPSTTFTECPPCPRNYLLVRADPHLEQVLFGWNAGASLVLTVIVVALVIAHWRLATIRGRRSIAPLIWMAAPPAAWAVAANIPTGLWTPPSWFWPWFNVALTAIPMGYVIGRVRDRLARGSVGDLIVGLGARGSATDLQQVLARTLRDPSLQVGYWMSEEKRFIDLGGREVVVASAGDPKRAATIIDHGDEPLAVLVHDAAVADDPKLVAAAAAAVSMAIQNQHLHALVRSQLDEVRASRTRIVAAQDEERRRLERDLHDGAQQRLVTLSLALGAARGRLTGGSDSSPVDALEAAASEVRAALAELRELARGIHPEVLTRAGLVPAIRSLCERASMPVTVEAGELGRLAAPVEAAAYFVISEALVNAAKHSQSSRVTVRAGSAQGRLRVEVIDDGVGGADRHLGSGIRGLEDRVRAVDGRLTITSPPGGGTTLVVEIPCES